MSRILPLLIGSLLLFFIGCRNQPAIETTKIESQNESIEKSILFLKFWNGMTQEEYSRIESELISSGDLKRDGKNEVLFKIYLNENDDSGSFYVRPGFESNLLYMIILSLPTEERTESANRETYCYPSHNIYLGFDFKKLLDLYSKKYGTPMKLIDKGSTTYMFSTSEKINIKLSKELGQCFRSKSIFDKPESIGDFIADIHIEYKLLRTIDEENKKKEHDQLKQMQEKNDNYKKSQQDI